MVEHTIYINLEKRKDRKMDIEKELADNSIVAERYNAIYTPGCGAIGCSYSHLNVLKMAKERGYKNILILEDDFTFTVSKEEFHRQLTTFFESNIPFDVCMISYNLREGTETSYPFLIKANTSYTTSGYIVNQHYYDVLINALEWSTPLLEKTQEHWNYACDHIYTILQKQGTWYCLHPRLGKQKSGYSDNCERYCEYDC